MRSRPPRRLRVYRPWAAPLLYAGLAIAMGFRGPELGSEIFGTAVARMSAESAIALLASIATGMMALTGIVFSLVFVALQFGTSSYGPRLGDELGSQRFLSHALGVFSGTFLYSSFAIRSVDMEGFSGIPLPAVVIAFLWLAASVVMLVLLVPMLQGLAMASVLDRLGRVAMADTRTLFPRLAGRDPHRPAPPPPSGTPTQTLLHQGPVRYLVALDEKALVRLASRHSTIVRVPHALGDPVFPGEVLVEVLGGSSPIPERLLRHAIVLSTRRTMDYNPMYVLRLLSDIAIRALSPAVNDPTTAVMAMDESQAILQELGQSDLEIGLVSDDGGALRLVFQTTTWDDAVTVSLSEILQYGSGSPQVQRRIGSLLRDLIETLPEIRHAALRLIADRRAAAIEVAFPSEAQRTEAQAIDRQGLGHREVSP